MLAADRAGTVALSDHPVGCLHFHAQTRQIMGMIGRFETSSSSPDEDGLHFARLRRLLSAQCNSACEDPRMPTRRRPGPAQERAAGKARRLGEAELFAQGRMHAEVAPSSVSPARARTSGMPAGSRWDRGAAQPRADRPRPQAVGCPARQC
jgi:hypothetical protein